MRTVAWRNLCLIPMSLWLAGCIYHGGSPTKAPGEPIGLTSLIPAIHSPPPPPGGFSSTYHRYSLVEARKAEESKRVAGGETAAPQQSTGAGRATLGAR